MSKETIEVPMIKHESIISIDISGLFYKRIQDLYSHYVDGIGIEKSISIIKNLEKDDIASIEKEDHTHAVNIETFLILIATIEDRFNKKNLIYKESIEIPNED